MRQAEFHVPAVDLLSIFLAAILEERWTSTDCVSNGFSDSDDGIFLMAWIVHFRETAYVVFLFLMGSDVRMLDLKSNERTVPEAQGV